MSKSNIAEFYPLSPIQQGILFHTLYQPKSSVYFGQLFCSLQGRINVAAFKESWQQVINRHSILRTAFVWEGLKEPIQVVRKQVSLPWEQFDWRGLSSIEQQAHLEIFLKKDHERNFELTSAPLIRITLIQLEDNTYQFIWSHHHLILDGWSLPLILKEVFAFYDAFCEGKELNLTRPRPYRDYIAWLHRQDLSAAESFWRETLKGFTAPTSLVIDKTLSLSHTENEQGECKIALCASMTTALQSLVRQHQLTLNTLVQGAWAMLLSRYSGEEDVVFGATVSGRPPELVGAESIVGMFINTLPMRVSVPAEASLLSWLKQLQFHQVELREYEYSPLVEIQQRWSQIPHNVPLFESIVVFENYPVDPALRERNSHLEICDVQSHDSTNYPITVMVIAQSELTIKISYDRRRFDADTITRMLGHLQTLLEGIVANPNQYLKDLPILTPAERKQLLELNNIADYSQNICLHQLFETQVEKTPDAVALIFEQQQITYRELNQKANQLAHYLQSLGVNPEVLVGIYLDRSLETIIGILGILKAGGAYLPIDPSYPHERLAFMLEDAQVPVLLTQKRLLETVPNYSGQIICLDEAQEFITEQSPENPLSNVCVGNLAYVIYTSGSTGTPKGVTVTHSNVVRLFAATQPWYDFNAEDVWTLFHSIAFDFSVWEIWGALLYGGKLVVVPYITSRSPADFYQLLNEQKVTVLNQTPSAFRQLIKAEESRESSEELNLRLVIFGGEALELQSLKPWFERHGDKTPQLVNMYGITETTVHVTYRPLTNADLNQTASVIGRPIPDLQVYLLDNNRQPVPIGVPGEMYIGGAGVARGYLNRPELTAERFISNCFSDEPEARLYKSGDLARYLPNGELEYLGRIDHQVKIRGFRIELGEIEAALSQHPSVEKAVVIAREDEPGNKRIVAYLVANEPLIDSQGSPIKSSELQSFLKEKLPEYMVPAAFVFLGSIPLTSNGKIDRSALPTPDTSRPELESAFAAPRTPQEQQLADIWANVLGVKQVGINDNFFELGGHSLLATRLVAKVRETFQVGLPLRCLFQCPTVATLGTLIAQQAKQIDEKLSINSLPAIVPNQDSRHQPFPLTDIQQAYWIGRSRAFELGNVAAHIYVEIDTVNLDFERFNKAWQELVERHDILRAIILPDGQQQILEKVPAYQIRVLDWRQQSSEFINARLEEVRRSLSHQILLCDRWPLFEIQASQLDQQKVRLHFSFDALISDAWSFQILGQELAKLYQNAKNRLNPLQISFRDYVLGEIASRNSEQYQRSLEYWQNRLPSLPPAPELPLAQNPAAIKQPRFVRRSGKLEAKTWQKLKDKATKASITHSGILLAAFAEILTVWSKTPRFTIGLTLFNRLPLHPQVNEIVGDFTSLTLLEVNNATPAPFAQRVQRIQEQLWDDLDHRYVSGVEVLRELSRHQNRISSAMMPVVFTSTLTQDAQSDEQNFPLDWLGKFIYGITQTPQVFLDHQVFEEAGSLVFNWDCVEELFPIGMLDDMFAAYCNFLQRLANETESWQEIHPQLLPPAQLTQRNAINATDAPVPAATLHSLFSDRVPLHPQKAAVVTSDRTLSYQELHRHSHYLACRLQQLGARPNTLIAVVMEKGWEQVVACLGILMSGAAYVPIDPALPPARRSHLFAQAEVQIAVTQSWLDTALEWPENLQRICIEDNEALGENSSLIPHASSLIPEENLAYVIYTSGSTGTPKGVTINHRGAVNTIVDINQRFNVGETDRVFALSSLSFDLSVYDIFGTLAAGGTLVIPEASKTQDPAHWAKLMQREKITIWNSVPALMQMMVEYAANTPKILASLRLVLLSGDWLPLTLPVQIQAAVKGVEVISLGGATEASIWSILYPIKQVNSAWKSIPYGQAMKNQRFYVLNEALEPCPVWVPGQLYIAGIGLAQGYWRDEIKTAASFFTHPRTGEKLYRTGDLGRFLPDGNIEFLGRQDFQVKVGGYRIELGEIESVLMQHPDVREAVVTTFGEQQNKRLVAYIIPESSSSISEASSFKELQNFLKEKLPEYMVPATFMKLDTLPLTSNGKVNRKALPAPNFVKSELDENFVAPQTPVEERLARIWSELLSLEQVGIYDSFFELGGNSLLATQLLTRLRETFQVELPLRDLFEVQTISGLCEKISQAKKKGEKLQEQEIVPVSRKAYRKKLSSLS